MRRDAHLRPQGLLVRIRVSRSMRRFAQVSGSELGIAEWIGVALAMTGRARGRTWKSDRIRAEA